MSDDERLERLAKLRALVEGHRMDCAECDSDGEPCAWGLRARAAIATVEAQGQEEAPDAVVPTPEKRPLRPGQKGYQGHRAGPGMPRRIWRPISRRNQKKLYRNREAWPRFRETAGIDGRITFESAWKRAKVHPYTLSHLVNGMTDTKLSTALDLCEKLGCTLKGFAKAMREAWEIAETRARAEEAIRDASGENHLDRTGTES